MEVRAQAWVADARVTVGSALPLPPLPTQGTVRLLHVFGGEVEVGGLTLQAGETAYLTGEGKGESVGARSDVDLVLFVTDPGALVFRGGMFSGNVLAR